MKIFSHAIAKIWTKRTGLEQTLLLISAALIGLVVALVIALSRDSAPLATEWGPVASWVGVVVTFLGFVGAIVALKVQKTSVDVAVDQHNKEKAKDEKDVHNLAVAAEAQALANKEKDVRAAKLDISVSRPEPTIGLHTGGRTPLEVKCCLVLPANTRFTNVELVHPDKPNDFRVSEGAESPMFYGTVAHGDRIAWTISGMEWPHGTENDAEDWVADRTFAKFTDPSGIRWQLDGHGGFTEIAKYDKDESHG